MARSINISESQRRSLWTMLNTVDQALCDFESWAKGREHAGVLFSEKNDLSPAQRQALLTQIESMRQKIRSLGDDLALERRTRTVRANIIASASTLWIGLVEVEPDQLRRYGPVDPQTVEYLGPKIRELVAGIQDLIEGCK
ncbi:MAG: hypothetical protein ACM3X4_07930 [Ignavibacteriales bacterium]